MIISIFIQFLIFIVKGCCQFIAVKIKKDWVLWTVLWTDKRIQFTEVNFGVLSVVFWSCFWNKPLNTAILSLLILLIFWFSIAFD